MKALQVHSIESLRFEGVSFEYDAGKPVFENLSADIPMGKTVLVTGGPGNGQSTFLKLLAVLLQPQSGKFLINGYNTTEMSFEEFLPIRRRIGYTFDYGGLFSNHTLLDNLALPLVYHKTYSREEAHAQVRLLATQFGFDRQITRRPAAVSGGLRKLVCVLRTFIQHPELLIMDDPFTGVDPESAKKIIRLIQERRESGELKHVFFTSRDELWPSRLGYEPLVIEDGGHLHFGIKEKVA